MEFLPFFDLAAKENFSIGTVLIGVCIYLIVKAIKFAESRMEKRGDTKGIAKRKEANTEVYGLLIKTLSNIGGDRLTAIEFSNGTKTVAKIPYEYLSATYEATSLGCPSAASKMQNILTSLFSTFLTRLASSSVYMLHLNDQDPMIPPSVYHYMNERGAQRSMSIPLQNPKTRQMIGYLCWDCGEGADFSGKDSEALEELKDLALVVGAYLTFAKG